MRARDGPLVLGPFHAWVGKGLSFVPHPIQVINVEDPHRWTWVPSVSANPYTPPPPTQGDYRVECLVVHCSFQEFEVKCLGGLNTGFNPSRGEGYSNHNHNQADSHPKPITQVVPNPTCHLG